MIQGGTYFLYHIIQLSLYTIFESNFEIDLDANKHNASLKHTQSLEDKHIIITHLIFFYRLKNIQLPIK